MKKNDSISIIVKPTNACNLRCKHCYHSGTGYSDDKMSEEVLERLISSTVSNYNNVSYIWHGGEPLTMPVEFYKKALELQDKYRISKEQCIRNSMQSNGTYITEEIAEFIADNNILIGLSFEGPYNDVLRGLTEKTEEGYANLKKHNIIPGSIAVVGKYNVDDLISVYEYFRQRNRPLKLNPIFDSGEASNNKELLLNDPIHYAEKMCELFDVWMYGTNTNIRISPFSGYAQSVISNKPTCCTNSGCLKHWLGITPKGDLYPCGRYYPEEFCLGNIMDFTDLHDVYRTETYKEIIRKTNIRRKKCREKCDVFELCYGGCLNEAMLEGGIDMIPEFSCSSYRIIIQHIKMQMDRALERGSDYLSKYNKYIKSILKRKMEDKS